MENFEELSTMINSGLHDLSSIWDEIGLDENALVDRKRTVFKVTQNLFYQMVTEEKGLKKKLVDDSESHLRLCDKLSNEMGVSYQQPDSSLSLMKLEKALRQEAEKLEEMKKERMEEVLRLKKKDEDICLKMEVDPFHLSSTVVPSTNQLEALKEHIRSMEEEKFDREERYLALKENILKRYMELEEEPETSFEREIACEETESFILSSSNLERAREVLTMLDNIMKKNQKTGLTAIEKIENLYDRLKLNSTDKYQFLSMHQGNGRTTLRALHLEVERLEEIKKENIEQFIINLRNELHSLWEQCFYSSQQINDFGPLHSIDFSEELLERHEAEVEKLKLYYEENQELFTKVSQRQEVWSKFMDLERRAKDPARLINARGNSLLMEEKERNKVNKALPRLEQELHDLIANWEAEQGREFLVGGTNFAAFIANQREEHHQGLESEKLAREKAKKENLLHETRFGAKPSTPAKLKGHNNTKTPRKMPPTPRSVSNLASNLPRSNSSRLVQKVSSAVATMRSPRAGRIGKGISPRIGGVPKGKKMTEKQKQMGILTQSNYVRVNQSVIKGGLEAGRNISISSTIPDTGFKRGEMLNSTEAVSTPDITGKQPSYMTPTAAATNRMFKTPTSSVSRTRRFIR